MGLGYAAGRVRAQQRMNRACVETLEGRRLLGGYGEVFTVEPQDYSSAGGAAWLPGGRFATSWVTGIAMNYRGHVRIYDASNTPLTTNDIDSAQAGAGELGVAADGHFVAAYSTISSATATGIWARVFGADGTPGGDPISVTADGSNGALAVAPDGRFAVAYSRSVPGYYAYGTFVRRFDPNGVPVGPEVCVGTYTTLGSSYTPAIGMEPSGKMTMAWYWYGVGIRVRQMNWDGTFAGDEFGAASGTVNGVWNPRVGVDVAGRFAVSWINPNSGIGLRMFGANAQPLGPEVYMPNSVTGSYDMTVTAAGQGVVIWAKGDIRGQRFDLATGSLTGDVLPIAPAGTGEPNYPVLAVSDTGQILCLWRSGNSAFGAPIQAATYGPGTPPTGIDLSNANVDENAAGMLVGKLTTVDPDAGDTFAYTLAGGHADLFTVVGDELRTAQPLDADTMPSVMIQVQVHDSSGWSFSQLVTITVNSINEAPISLSLSSSGSVAENQPAGALVGTLMAYDPDAGDTATFLLVSGNGDGGNGAFAIVGNELRTAGPLDYETYSSYPIRVRVTDGGGLWFEKTLTVAVANVNEAPSGLNLSNALVQADRPIGRTVGALAASDPDARTVLTYSLVGGEGSTDNGLFQIVGSELRTKVVLSYPHAPLSIRVRATDEGGLWTEQAFALSVVEYNDPPTATFASTGTVGIGDTSARVLFTNVHDSPGDMAGGFTYSYDFGNDGTFEVAGSSSAEAVVPAWYLTAAGVVAIRGWVTDVRGAFSEYVTNLTVRERPTAMTGGPYDEQEGRPVLLNGSASGLMIAAAARYEWDLDYDGVTFSVDVEGHGATFRGETLPVGTVRTVALRVCDGDGVGSGIATTTVRVVSAPPTATFGAVETAMMGQTGHVAFAGVADSVADMAAGLTYSYDFDDDGTYDVVSSTSAQAEVPASYLGSPGVRTVRGRIADQSGAFSEYEAELIVNPPMDWQPMYVGLSYNLRGSDADDGMYTETIEYVAGDDGGINEAEVDHYDTWKTETTTDHVVPVGSTWCLTRSESSTNGQEEPTMTFSKPIPEWDEGIASGKVLSWSGITVPSEDIVMADVEVTGPMVTSGSVKRSGLGSVTLNDGTRFEDALKVKIVMTMRIPVAYAGRGGWVTATVTEYDWHVRGIGIVRTESQIKTTVRSGSRSRSGTIREWEEISEIPEWSEFSSVADNTWYISGTSGADKITVGVDGGSYVAYRNGIPNGTPVGSVQKIVIVGGDGNDLVDVRTVALPVEIDGGAGNDTIYGGLAGDRLAGGDGNDRVYGGDGNDSLSGGAGVDLLQGQNGDDWIDGNDGTAKEKISGGAGIDTAYVDVGEKAGAVETRIEAAAPLLLGIVAELDLGDVGRGVL